MTKEEITFNWEHEIVKGFGKIFRPYVQIQLKTAEAGWKPFDFIADTGADVTMLPYSMVKILGIDLEKMKENEATGIGGYKVKTWQTKIPIKIGDWELKVRASLTSENLTPLLLGRIDTLDNKFSWIFDHQKEKIIFRK